MAVVQHTNWKSYAGDVFTALKQATTAKSPTFLKTWVYTPLGITALLTACFGIDLIFRTVAVSFPASVACLILLFLGLLGCEWLLGAHRTRWIVGVVDVPAGWSLRWINIFFMPAFVLLPLSPSISIVEVMKIIAVFVIGFLVMMVMAAYLTRGLQLLTGSSKRAHVQRAEELGENHEDIPLRNAVASSSEEQSRATSISQAAAPSTGDLTERSPSPEAPQTPPQLRLQRHHHSQHEAAERDAAVTPSAPAAYSQVPLPPSRAERWGALLTTYFDMFVFVMLFCLVGLPVYYSIGYAMPAQLSLNVVAFMAAMEIPLRWKQYLHPVLVASLFTALIIWALAEIRGDDLETALHAYKTGANYLLLWEQPHSAASLLPGAGDIFGTILDASIVSLALPMFQYRRELKEHFVSIVVPNVLISIASLFTYPPLCYAIGISAQRSLAFASRSLTLALAIPATKNLGGDTNTVAAVAIISGILGVLAGKRILDWLRIPEDDYVTRGVTLGVNSSAIATALLLRTDPRAAALSSLSMSLFGTVTVLFTSVPPITNIIRSLVGL